jgi:hypothetical protein
VLRGYNPSPCPLAYGNATRVLIAPNRAVLTDIPLFRGAKNCAPVAFRKKCEPQRIQVPAQRQAEIIRASFQVLAMAKGLNTHLEDKSMTVPENIKLDFSNRSSETNNSCGGY